MTSFSPLNFYTFAAARGEFLRPNVRALLAGAPLAHSPGSPSDMAGCWSRCLIPNRQLPGSAWTRCSFRKAYRARRRNNSMPQECNPLGNVRCEAPHVYVC
jgi:hypothetical protein